MALDVQGCIISCDSTVDTGQTVEKYAERMTLVFTANARADFALGRGLVLFQRDSHNPSSVGRCTHLC
jgi:hypothetical protein